MEKEIQRLLKEKAGIRLDIGCGASKESDWVGIDILPLKGVDIVHDLEETPWPLPDNSVLVAKASHVLEHINPAKGIFVNVMNEIWRVLKPDGQFAFVVPYAGSHGFWQDPTHCNGINETTMLYFSPFAYSTGEPSPLYGFYQPKPWHIQFQALDRNGNLEVVLRKLRDDKSFHEVAPDDITKELSNGEN